VPVLWSDVDWDYISLYVMMQRKIKYMRLHQLHHANHTDFEEVMKQMQTVEDALERLIKDDYLSEDHEKHNEKFPRRKATLEADGMYHMPPMSDEEAADVRRLGKMEEALKQEDLEEIGKAFRMYVRGWWD
jgi:hypothetical protein